MSNTIDDDGEICRFKKRRLSTASVKSVVSSWETSCTVLPLTTPSQNNTNNTSPNTLITKTPQIMHKNSTFSSTTPSNTIETEKSKNTEKMINKQASSNSVKNNVNGSKQISNINSILKQPTPAKDLPDPAKVPVCKAPTTSLCSNPFITIAQPQFVTWKDIKDRATAAEQSKSIQDSNDFHSSASIQLDISSKTLSSRTSNYEGHSVAMRTKSFQPSSVHSSPVTNCTKRASQPDLTNHRLNYFQRPTSQNNLQIHQPVIHFHVQESNILNSSCILHPVSCTPSSSNTSVMPKTMQRPVSVPPRTIHPSLRSHFAIDKSKGLSVNNSGSIRPGIPSTQQYQPIASPLLNTRDKVVGPRQTYQHYQTPSGVKNTRIETDIM